MQSIKQLLTSNIGQLFDSPKSESKAMQFASPNKSIKELFNISPVKL